MKNVLVRDIPEDVVEELKQRAKENGRSLQAEIRLILEETSDHRKRMRRFMREADRIRNSFGDRKFSDSAKLIRRDRDRR